MRRQRMSNNYMDDDNSYSQNGYSDENGVYGMDRLINRPSPSQTEHRFESTIEAKVETGDTLQALALRFHCTVADIKRLNKIDKDNEIFARKVVKIPLTVHSVLLGNMPTVHRSGNNSPKQASRDENDSVKVVNPLEESRIILDEKLMVASVNAAGGINNSSNNNNNINRIILNSNIEPGTKIYSDEVNDITDPLIDSFLNAENDMDLPQPHAVRGPALTALDCSGSDCDISWVCLFIVILALCIVIPLLYVFYLTDPTHHRTHSHELDRHIDN